MPSIRLFRCLLILTAAMSLNSCGRNISYDRDASIPVPPGATVAFAGGTYEGRENLDPAVGNDIVHRRVEAAIVNELQSRGFKLVDDRETADFLVRYFVRVNLTVRQVATTNAALNRTPNWGPAGSGWGTGWGTGVTTVQPVFSSNASLVVDLVQRSTRHTAWRGIWQGDPGSRAPTQREIDATMARIFRSAPVAH